MKKLLFVHLLPLFLFSPVFSQTKTLQGDTLALYFLSFELQKSLDLKDFKTAPEGFNFRFTKQGQIVEIAKDSTQYHGRIINYSYHLKSPRHPMMLLSNNIILSSVQAEKVYHIIQESRMFDLPSDQAIEKWSSGFDGMTYTIEHADTRDYWCKKYWTPTIQDAIPEALIVLDFVKNVDDFLNLSGAYVSFLEDLPRKGCYNAGGSAMRCYISNTTDLGYSGAAKLPFGFFAAHRVNYWGKTKIDAGFFLQYHFDTHGRYHLHFKTSKWKIFHHDSRLSDFLTYHYQERFVNIDELSLGFENHQIAYGLHLKNNFSFGMGLDYIRRKNDMLGGYFHVHQWFPKAGFSTTLTTSIYDQQYNYKAEVLKSFRFNYKVQLPQLFVGFAYEDFMAYKDLYFKVFVMF